MQQFVRLRLLVAAAAVALSLNRVNADEPAKLPDDAKVTIGPTLVHVKDGKFDYKVWVFSVTIPSLGRTNSQIVCLANEEETPPDVKNAYQSALQGSIGVKDPATEKGDDLFIVESTKVFYYLNNPLVTYAVVNGKQHLFCCTPTMCINSKTNTFSLMHLAGPVTGKRVKVEGREGEYPVVPRCKQLAEKQFETKAFGKPDPEIFKLDPDLLKSVPRPE